MFNKQTLFVEESVHLLFDETNSLIEHDTQDEEFEHGLVRKDLSVTQSSMLDNGKVLESEPSPGSNNMEGKQGPCQSGRSNVKPNLVQNWPTQLDSSRTDLGTRSRIDPEPVSPCSQERLENVFVDSIIPRPWKHQCSHPCNYIMFDINTKIAN